MLTVAAVWRHACSIKARISINNSPGLGPSAPGLVPSSHRRAKRDRCCRTNADRQRPEDLKT
jgi:hypothetical protein